MIGNKRIAIFQSTHPLQMHTCNLVKKLLDHGYVVDLFLYNVLAYYNIDEIGMDENNLTINIYGKYVSAYQNINVSQSKLLKYINFPRRCATFAHHLLKEHIIYGYFGNLLGIDTFFGVLSQQIVEKTLANMYGKDYVCLIGIEKMGLIWSGSISDKLKIPNIYYSLELYTNEHFLYLQQSNKNKYIKKTEEIYHKKCHATIIQDRLRANVLYESNGVNFDRVKPIYLPVSTLGGCIRNKTNYCYDKWGFDREDVIILYYGLICQFRWIDKVINISKLFPPQWKLILQGIDTMGAQAAINQTGVKDRVVLSTTMLPPSELIELILSATIGVVIYGNENKNDILTGFSSEKLSIYLQCGIPIIAFNYPSYEHIKNYQCGVLIDSIDEIPDAITKILDNYSRYQKNAYTCFDEIYDYSKNFKEVLEYIDNLS